jgi:hypothetical protein
MLEPLDMAVRSGSQEWQAGHADLRESRLRHPVRMAYQLDSVRAPHGRRSSLIGVPRTTGQGARPPTLSPGARFRWS